MGVWDFKWLEQEIEKWMKLALDDSLLEGDRALYLKKAREVIQSRDRYAREWEVNTVWWKEHPNG